MPGSLRESACSTSPATHALLGSAPDIGAFEFVPPPPPAAAALTSLSVSPKSFRPRSAGGAIVEQVAACKEGWSHGWLRPHRRGTGEIQGRAGAARAGRRRQVRQADRGQPGQEEVHSVQGPEGGLRRPGRRRREQLQILGTGRPQGAEAGAVPAGRERRNLAAANEVHDKTDDPPRRRAPSPVGAPAQLAASRPRVGDGLLRRRTVLPAGRPRRGEPEDGGDGGERRRGARHRADRPGRIRQRIGHRRKRGRHRRRRPRSDPDRRRSVGIRTALDPELGRLVGLQPGAAADERQRDCAAAGGRGGRGRPRDPGRQLADEQHRVVRGRAAEPKRRGSTSAWARTLQTEAIAAGEAGVFTDSFVQAGIGIGSAAGGTDYREADADQGGHRDLPVGGSSRSGTRWWSRIRRARSSTAPTSTRATARPRPRAGLVAVNVTIVGNGQPGVDRDRRQWQRRRLAPPC